MIESLIARDESKTIEFKENCKPLDRIVRTVVAFASTSGGAVVIGVRDKTKEVVGVEDALADEERLANAFANNIHPLLVPDIQIHAWRDRQLIVVAVPHAVGPYYVKADGPEEGVFVRLGSTSRCAGPELIAEIQRLGRNVFFDEQPSTETNSEAIDFRAASELFAELDRRTGKAVWESLGLLTKHDNRRVPSRGAVLLFGKDRRRLFPDAVIACARFAGTNSTRFLDRTGFRGHSPSMP
jgi:predicted HTH transcriptional regulator